ncbi:protein kinase-like protein [Metarhizium acridum CQMa 102]|uniref:Protein kinase-like protein n=1 Tax=Metarhizium acridum (strain CQMa 102) TaxID=655827 RepID=E9EEB5_METAQ|nr:protein kinase-like protein [Metarhizium acridum CQMa 102]EFY85743.1 protein kinase-like protein [Metarhizium acridum CQMa 102]
MGENFREPDIVPPCILTVTLHEAPGLPTLHGKLRYALLNYNQYEVPVEPYLVSASEPRMVQKDYNVCKFYVTRFAELTISFYVRDTEDAPAVLLGAARVKPFDISKTAKSHWLPVGHDCAARLYILMNLNMNYTSFRHFSGHVVLCGFGLFILETKNRGYTTPRVAEYPAPELLLGKEATRLADYWTLGVFLYKMLVGVPLFYDENPSKIMEKILKQPLEFPGNVSAAAKDLITCLLDRRPEQRLGANGASEVKNHSFFNDIDWQVVLQRNYEPDFKPEYTPGSNPLCGSCNFTPNHVSGFFEQHGVSGSFELPEPPSIFKELNSWAMAQRGRDSKIPETTIQADNEWDLVWREAQPQSFHFYNRVTGETRPVPSRAVDPYTTQDAATYSSVSSDTTPSLTHKLDALEAALQAGYDHAVSELLEYDIDLNVEIFGRDRKSPLHWAVKHKNLHLVCLFLEHGASADFGGPALIQAVKVGHLAIAEALVLKTNRVACTQSLGLAVDQRDTNMVRPLLGYGVHCDFGKDDRPYPQPSWDLSFEGYDVSRPEEFKPPLIRAIQKHEIDVVRLLLSHGADPNIALHDTSKCGRAVELAMEAEQLEIVQLLLDSGADISLPSDVWEKSGHRCHILKRPVYQKVTARLRAAMVAQKRRQIPSFL